MNILALDTAAAVLSIALSSGTDIRYFEMDGGLRHGELLMGAVDRLLDSAGLEPPGLECVACMKGPGSFTGLRIGFATAKGLALALGIPLVSVPTLDCMAAPLAAWPGIVLPVMDAKKDHFFTALYRNGVRESDYLDATAETIAATFAAKMGKEGPVMLSGPAAELLRDKISALFEGSLKEGSLPGRGWFFIDPAGKRGRARELLDIIMKRGILDSEAEGNGPLYLRKSDAELTFENK
jgi:tRNA threonylcarbamoyladenosine biosynthesis protein TsaB